MYSNPLVNIMYTGCEGVPETITNTAGIVRWWGAGAVGFVRCYVICMTKVERKNVGEKVGGIKSVEFCRVEASVTPP